MDARRLHLGAGFSSLFAYCCEVLRLSESAAYKRIEVARAARGHPLLLERLADGSLSLATARLLAPHLTASNHQELLSAAAGLGKRAVEELVARRFPRPDVPALVRRLPVANQIAPALQTLPASSDAAPIPAPVRPPLRPVSPPLVVPLAADRYQIRFTASASTRDKLRQAQDLLRHVIPDGDPAAVIDRALTALIERLAKEKCAQVSKPSPVARQLVPGSRRIPAIVRRAVWARDQARCAFVAASGWRCRERGFLEFHHVRPFAVGGGATVANIQLRCRAHNGHEAALVFRAEATRPGASWGIRPFSDSA